MSNPGVIYAIGEAMLEVSKQHQNCQRNVFGGDSYNTCVYLSRLGISTEYVTAIGYDASSNALLAAARSEGVGIRYTLRHPSRSLGMYLIENDDDGERRFHYCRDQSAARQLFEIDGHEVVVDAAKRADWLYVTGITLSLYGDAGHAKIFDIARSVRARGGQVVFDPNYRPQGWSSQEAAQKTISAFARYATIVLPTFEDERALWGALPAEHHLSVQQQYANRWFQAGVRLVIQKCGPKGAEIHEPGVPVRSIRISHPVSAIDTTGAGDSFNAALLAGLIQSKTLDKSVRAANVLAGTVIQHRGAIAPRQTTPRTLFSRN